MTTYSDRASKRDLRSPEFPGLIFLDTNIVQNLRQFGEFIYDNSHSPEMERRVSAKGSRFAEDISALAHFMALGRRANWPIAVSPRTLGEIEAIPQPGKRLDVVNWGVELAHYFSSNFKELQDLAEKPSYADLTRFTFSQRERLSELLRILPQDSDRQLIIDALEYSCDIFLTMDYRTLWRYRDEVERLGIKVMRPVELLDYMGNVKGGARLSRADGSPAS